MTLWLILVGVAVLLVVAGRWNHLRGRTHRWVCSVCHFQASSGHALERHLAGHSRGGQRAS